MGKNKVKKPIYKRWWFIALVVLVILGAIGSGGDDNAAEEPNQEEPAVAEENDDPAEEPEEEEEVAEENMTVDEFLEYTVIEIMGEETNEDKPTFIKVSNIGDDENVKQVFVNANSNLTTNMMVTGMLGDASEFFEMVSQNEKVMNLERIALSFSTTLVDSYGNEEDRVVHIIDMTPETLNKINWENFNYNNIPTIADQYFLHNALQE